MFPLAVQVTAGIALALLSTWLVYQMLQALNAWAIFASISHILNSTRHLPMARATRIAAAILPAADMDVGNG